MVFMFEAYQEKFQNIDDSTHPFCHAKEKRYMDF